MLIISLFWLAILFLLWKIARQYYKKEISAWEFSFWLIFWIMVGVGLVFVRKLDRVAQFFGVERAIDLLVYVAIAVLFYLAYRIYVKIEKIERDITKIVRRDALEDAEK